MAMVQQERVRFTYDGNHIHCLASGDIDIRRSRASLRTFRQSLRCLRICWTCFQKPRTVINYPCGCFCNCYDCSTQMRQCSLCYMTILGIGYGFML